MDDPFDLPPDVLKRVPLFAELAKVLAWHGGPVNWDLARQVAVSVAAERSGPALPAAAGPDEQLADQVRLAELWLAESTGLPQPTSVATVRVVSPVDWADASVASFAELIDPVAAKASGALDGGFPGVAGEEGAALQQAIAKLGPMMMGIQAGTMLGQVAKDILGTHEVPLPVEEPALLLIGPSIDAVAAEHGLDPQGVRQWVALRAAARRLTLEGNPWVRAHFFALYHDLVSTLDVTLAEGMDRLRSMDLSDPSKLQEAIGDGSLFAAEPSPQTAQAAERVARFLAVIDAHARVAVESTGARLGAEALRLAEVFARREAEPGPGLLALASFLGLDLGAHYEAAVGFVRGVLARGDWSALGPMWEDATSFPSAEELTDPGRWLERVGGR